MNDKTGGPAFPEVSTSVSYSHDSDHRYADVQSFGGMTLRDYFAIRATEQDIENHRGYEVNKITGHPIYTMTVEQAKYAYADAMLTARESGE